MNGAPLPNFTAIVRATPLEQLPQLTAALAEAGARAMARIACEASGRERRPAPEVEWVTTLDAAKIAGYTDLSDENKRQRARQRIAQWARGQAWATKPSGRILRIDVNGFKRWLDLKRKM